MGPALCRGVRARHRRRRHNTISRCVVVVIGPLGQLHSVHASHMVAPFVGTFCVDTVFATCGSHRSILMFVNMHNRMLKMTHSHTIQHAVTTPYTSGGYYVGLIVQCPVLSHAGCFTVHCLLGCASVVCRYAHLYFVWLLYPHIHHHYVHT